MQCRPTADARERVAPIDSETSTFRRKSLAATKSEDAPPRNRSCGNAPNRWKSKTLKSRREPSPTKRWPANKWPSLPSRNPWRPRSLSTSTSRPAPWRHRWPSNSNISKFIPTNYLIRIMRKRPLHSPLHCLSRPSRQQFLHRVRSISHLHFIFHLFRVYTSILSPTFTLSISRST